MNSDPAPDLLTRLYTLRSYAGTVRDLAEKQKLLTIACDIAVIECETSAVIAELQKRSDAQGN